MQRLNYVSKNCSFFLNNRKASEMFALRYKNVSQALYFLIFVYLIAVVLEEHRLAHEIENYCIHYWDRK